MSHGIVVIVDNDEHALNTRWRYLKRKRYDVVPILVVPEAIQRVDIAPYALTLGEVKKKLERTWTHVVIMDIRLEDDGDALDTSGLVLLEHVPSIIPTIVLTGFSEERITLKEVARLQLRNQIAIHLSKQMGVDVMGDIIEECYPTKIRIDRDVEVYPEDLHSFLTQIIPNGPPEGVEVSALEMELKDLFRKLYYGYSQIQLSSRSWFIIAQKQNACAVFAQAESCSPHARQEFIVTCGRHESLVEEIRKVREQNRKNTFVAETLHFAAIARPAAFWQRNDLVLRIFTGILISIVPTSVWFVFREQGALGVMLALAIGVVQAIIGYIILKVMRYL